MELWKETEQRMPRERRKQRTVEEINIDNQSGRSNKYIHQQQERMQATFLLPFKKSCRTGPSAESLATWLIQQLHCGAVGQQRE